MHGALGWIGKHGVCDFKYHFGGEGFGGDKTRSGVGVWMIMKREGLEVDVRLGLLDY